MGKLAVPEYILNKPGPLTPAEFDKMKLHASVGADILSAIDFPYPVVPIVRHHHENWDGSGYPDGLSGPSIPIGARILSVVDCFDALTSDRPYRPRLSDQEAIQILLDRRGKMYDPLVVDTFVAVYHDLAATVTQGSERVPLRAMAATNPAADPATTRFEEISGSSEEMLTLFELARGLRSESDPDSLCGEVFAHVRRLIPASLCVFYVYEVDTDELIAAYASGNSAPLVSGIRIALGQRVSGWVAAHRRSIRNSDPVLDLGVVARVMRSRPKSSLSTPVVHEKVLVGVLSLYSTEPAAFTDEHLRILEAVATQVAGTLQEAFERSRGRVAVSVAGQPSVRNEGKGAAAPSAMILAKVIGGQRRGNTDEAARSSARETFVGCLRTGDQVFDVPEGFAALLPSTDLATASLICRAIEERLRGRNLALKLHTVVVSAPQDGGSVPDLLEAAHARLSQSDQPDSIH
jgi:putative methionine-R-sulfoxide reductase with GAF domain